MKHLTRWQGDIGTGKHHSAVGSKKAGGKKEEVGAVDKYSHIDLILLPKSLRFAS
jgi:hypothetical protein